MVKFAIQVIQLHDFADVFNYSNGDAVSGTASEREAVKKFLAATKEPMTLKEIIKGRCLVCHQLMMLCINCCVPLDDTYIRNRRHLC